MGAIVAAKREAILKHWRGEEALTPPTSWKIGLSVADFDSAGVGFVEPTDTAYEKLVVTWGAAASRAVRNSGALVWAMATEDWGPIYGYGLYDQSDVLWACHRFSAIGSGILRNQRARFLDGGVALGFSSDTSYYWTTATVHRMLEFLCRGGAYALPAGHWLSLSSTSPTPAGVTDGFTEISGNGYARVEITDAFAAMTVLAQRTSDRLVSFPQATGDGGLGNVLGIGIHDAAAAGTCWRRVAATCWCRTWQRCR